MQKKSAISRGWDRFFCWIEVSRQRRQLKADIAFLSKDIAISYASLEREAKRPFWDIGAMESYQPKESGTTSGNADGEPLVAD